MDLRVDNLSFSYSSRTPVLEGWSANFAPGVVTAITGPSGRGKSTLLYLLGLMLKPQRGTILLEGLSVSRMSDAERSKLRATKFGFVFQDSALDPSRTIIDNVIETSLYNGYPRNETARFGMDLLEEFGVDTRARARPGEVSGGQAQRIAMCRALVNRPSVLLADEPTGNLDDHTTSIVMNALVRQAELGMNVIVVTHDRRIADTCSNVIEL